MLLCIALSYCDSRCSDLKFLYPRVSDSKCSCGHGNFWLPKKIIWLSATHQLKSPTIVPDVSISWFVWEKVSDKMKILQISIKAFLMSLYLKYFLSAGRLSRNTCKLYYRLFLPYLKFLFWKLISSFSDLSFIKRKWQCSGSGSVCISIAVT